MVLALDPGTADEAVLDWMYDLRTVSDRVDSPAEPPEDRFRFRALLRHPPSGERRWGWRAGSDGYALLWLDEGSTQGVVKLYVDLARRRRGTGRALLDAAAGQARTVGCRLVRARHAGTAGAGFSAAVGAEPGTANLRNLLILPARDTGKAIPGYELRSWLTRTPDDLLDQMVVAHAAMNDAPRPAGIEPDRMTAQRLRDVEAAVGRRGVQLRVTAALADNGELAGFTELRVAPEPGAMASTEDTGVLAEHRGRGLATWIKAESLRRLRADRPDVRRVITENAETNAPMLAVNARLGFTPVSRLTAAVLHLT